MDEDAAHSQDLAGVSPADPLDIMIGSTPPRPENPPPPTCWPFVTAVGLTIAFWGIVLNLFVVCVGVCVFLVGMAGLLGDWVREHRNEST